MKVWNVWVCRNRYSRVIGTVSEPSETNCWPGARYFIVSAYPMRKGRSGHIRQMRTTSITTRSSR